MCVCEKNRFRSLSLRLLHFFSVFRLLSCAYILAATSLHKPIMVSVRHAVATNDDAIIHIAAMPSVSSSRVLLQFFFFSFPFSCSHSLAVLPLAHCPHWEASILFYYIASTYVGTLQCVCACVIRCCCSVIISLVRFLPFPHEKAFVAYQAFFFSLRLLFVEYFVCLFRTWMAKKNTSQNISFSRSHSTFEFWQAIFMLWNVTLFGYKISATILDREMAG